MNTLTTIVGLCAALSLAAPAAAEVTERREDGFVVAHVFETPASPQAAYAMTGQPGRWWNGEHSWSGDAANMTLALEPGGCFCEALPGGGARHGEVLMAWPGKRLTLEAGLGPLLGVASGAFLDFGYAPSAEGTRVTVTYRVEGHGLGALADPVDGVIGEQVERLKALLDEG